MSNRSCHRKSSGCQGTLFQTLEHRRLFAFGQTDTDFGIDGRARVGFPSSSFAAAAQDMFVAAGGKIVAAGNAGMARFTSDGTFDISFGFKGKTTFSGFNYKAVAVDSSNRIYVLVSASSGTVVLRYTADGKSDANFASGGSALVSASTTFSPSAIDVQDDGKILVAGTARSDAGNGSIARVYRLTTAGVADTGFVGDGVLEFNFGGKTALTPIARDKVVGIGELNGKIYVGGGTVSWAASFSDPETGQYVPPLYGNAYFASAKINSNGSFDTSYDSDGVLLSAYADESAVQTTSLNTILPSAWAIGKSSGNVYVAAQNNSNSNGTTTVAHFSPAGSVVSQHNAESGSPLYRPTDLVEVTSGVALVVAVPRNNSGGVAMATVSDDDGFRNPVLSKDNNPETPEVDGYYSTSPAVALGTAGSGRFYIAGGGSGDEYNYFVLGEYAIGVLSGARPDEFINARANDIVLDNEGGLHVAYYDAAKNNLMYAYRGPNLLWNAPVTVDKKPNAGQYVSIDVNSKNKPGIAYFDGTGGDLKLTTSDGKKWSYFTVESKGSTGLYPSLQFDNTDRATMTYYKKTGGDLRFAVMTSPGIFGYENVETTGDVGRSNTLVASTKSGRYTVSYFDNTTNQVKWARHEKGGKWNIKVAAQTSGGADFISMAYGYSYEPAISYYDAKGGDLKLSYYSANAKAFVVKALATSGAQGLYSNAFFPSYYGQPAVFHYNRSQDRILLLRDAVDANPSTTASIEGVGRYLSLATNSNGLATDLAYFDADENLLKVRPAPSADN